MVGRCSRPARELGGSRFDLDEPGSAEEAHDEKHQTNHFWHVAKRRRVESGTFPLANGVSSRVGKLRAYGNAICPPLAAEFVSSFMEAVGIEPIR